MSVSHAIMGRRAGLAILGRRLRILAEAQKRYHVQLYLKTVQTDSDCGLARVIASRQEENGH